ncbi:MAG: hypothetical protein MJA29_13860, partial [Candidatus Omnitrophica bacterium]|nr:hypothetical protein [Candidatus Omnitrophota bacterium]
MFTIEDPALLTKLQLTQSQIEELLQKDIDGVKIPSETSVEELASTTLELLNKRRAVLPNGLNTSLKAPIAASQALDLEDTFQDTNRTKELATRGKACARQDEFWPDVPGIPDIPKVDIPFEDLPNPSKQVESLFGAISSAVNAAIKVFDGIFNAAKKVIDPFVNKVQNLNSV